MGLSKTHKMLWTKKIIPQSRKDGNSTNMGLNHSKIIGMSSTSLLINEWFITHKKLPWAFERGSSRSRNYRILIYFQIVYCVI